MIHPSRHPRAAAKPASSQTRHVPTKRPPMPSVADDGADAAVVGGLDPRATARVIRIVDRVAADAAAATLAVADFEPLSTASVLQPDLDRGSDGIDLEPTRLGIEQDPIRGPLRTGRFPFGGFRQLATLEIEFALSRLNSPHPTAHGDGRDRPACVRQHEGLLALYGTLAAPFERARHVFEPLKTILREQQ